MSTQSYPMTVTVKPVDPVTSLGPMATFGRFQRWQYMLAMLPIMFTAMSNINYVFSAAAEDARCAVPTCESPNPNPTKPPWWPAVEPRCSRPVFNRNSHISYTGINNNNRNISNNSFTSYTGINSDRRNTGDIGYIGNISVNRNIGNIVHTDNTSVNSDNGDIGNCSVHSFLNQSVPCDAWVYSSRNSIVSEFNLACQEWKRTLVGTIHNVGVMISMPLMGFVSDRWGRRKSIIASGLGLVVGAFKPLTSGPGWTGYPLYLLLELLEAALVTGTYTTCFVLMLELVGKNKRIFSALVLGIMISTGELLLTLIVWLVPYWRHFQLFLYCPAFIFLAYIFLLEESLRWLIVNEKNDKAVTLVQKIAKCNGVALSKKTIEAIKNSRVGFDADVEVEKEKFHPKLLFSSAMLIKRLLVCSWWWFTAAFVYYGLLINSVTLPGNKIINFALSSLSTLVAEFIAAYLLNKIGRKFTLLGGFLLCGVACVSEAFVPKAAKTELIVIFLFGKMCISICFNGIYVYTSELVPTSARGCLVGACSMVARVGSVLAPLTPLLGQWWSPLPTLLFGGAALVAAGLALTTPETLRRDLPDTVAQANAFHRK